MENKMICPKAQSGECKIKCDFGKPHNCKTSHPFSDHLTCMWRLNVGKNLEAIEG